MEKDEGAAGSWRNSEEHYRYVILLRIYAQARGKVGREVSAATLADEISISREMAFRIIEYLAARGLVDYHGAGPRVSVTQAGAELVERGDTFRIS